MSSAGRDGLKTRSAAATNSAGLVFFPLLFLTPNFVPRDLLTRPMEIAATLNPVTYVMEAMRSLMLREDDRPLRLSLSSAAAPRSDDLTPRPLTR